MMLGLSTEAATKFKHALTTTQCIPVLKESVRMIKEIAGGKIASDILDIYPTPEELKELTFSIKNLKQLTGLSLGKNIILEILRNLEYEIISHDEEDITVRIPFWRQDNKIKEDIFEDIARIYGYNNIEPVLPTKDLTPAKENPMYALKKEIRQLLSDNGCNETDTYSFTDTNTIKKAGLDPEKAYTLKNPLSPELSLMRTSLIPTLLTKIQYNLQEGYEKLALFEMNLTHQKDNVDNTGLPIEDWHLAIVMSSQEKREDSAYYLAKNYFQKVLDLKKITPTYTLIADILENDLPVDVKDTLFMFDPNTSAIARYNGEILGVIGEIDNKVKNNFKLPKYSAAIDLNLQKLIGLESSIQITNRLSKFPESRIDLCFEVETNVNYADIHNIILKEINNEELIGNVTCLDIYQDKNIESKKKMTFRIAVRNTIKTLTDRDIRDLTEVIKNKIEKITRGRLI